MSAGRENKLAYVLEGAGGGKGGSEGGFLLSVYTSMFLLYIYSVGLGWDDLTI